MLKFKIDENLPIEIKQLLIDHGHDAMTVADQKLGGQPDGKIHAVCQLERRCVITLDLGFGDIRQYPPSEHAGVIVLRALDQSKESVIELLLRHIHLLEIEPIEKKLWIMESDRVRIRD